MRKWTYLVAALLLTGTTATFTGCIDTDEPAGITDLRGAKAELIKAQAAVKLVEVDMEKAKVAHQLVVTEGQKLANEGVKIENDLRALAIEREKLVIEMQKATNEAVKAELANRIAQADKDKADIENAKALAAEQFKATILEAQKTTALAQESYDIAIKAIEAAKLLMTNEELMIVVDAQDLLEDAAAQLQNKRIAMENAQKALNTALTSLDLKNLAAKLANELEQKELDLKLAKIVADKYSKLLETPISKDVTAWENEVAKMKTDEEACKQNIANAEVAIAKIKVSADYKAANALVTDKNAALATASAKYTTANTTPVQKYAAYSNTSVAGNQIVVDALNAVAAAAGSVTGYTNGAFTYAKGKYTEQDFIADPSTVAAPATIKGWLTLIDGATDGIRLEDIAWSTKEIAKATKDKNDAATAYTNAVKDWATARDFALTATDGDVAAAKKEVEASIIAYNNDLGLSKLNVLASKLKKYYSIAEAVKGQCTSADVTAVVNGASVTKSISGWLLEAESNLANIVGVELGFIVWNGEILKTTAKITSDNEKKLLELKTLIGAKTAYDKWVAASKKAFGPELYMVDGDKPRMVEPESRDLVKAEKEVAAYPTEAVAVTNYGALGKKLYTVREVARMQNILDQADTYKALRGAIVAQQTALTAELAANTAAVAKLKDAVDAAQTDVNAATKALNALTAKEDKAINENNAMLREVCGNSTVYPNSVRAVIETKLAQFLGGRLTAEDFMNDTKQLLITANANVVTSEGAVAKAKKDIELYNNGDYDEAYAITRAQENLAIATNEYENAYVIYKKAVAQVKLVIETLVK